jgi:hypothetical protein
MRLTQAIRGAVCHIYQYRFSPTTNPQNKFCVLLESHFAGAQSIIGVFTTSNLENETYRWRIRANIPNIPGESIIDLLNFKDIPINVISSRNTSYVCTLPTLIMQEIDDSLPNVPEINPPIFVRMLPP